MLRFVGALALLLSLLSSAPTWADASPCVASAQVGGLMAGEILGEGDLRQALLCATKNDDTFAEFYQLRIDKGDEQLIAFQRKPEQEPPLNQRNDFSVRFRAVFQNKLLTLVRCQVTVHTQDKLVMFTLNNCRANAFGADPLRPLQASGVYVRLP